MKKRKLEFDYSYDFELLGVRTSLKGFKLAWLLNKQLNCRLKKIGDLSIPTENEFQPCLFDYYLHESPINTLRVFKNKANESETNKVYLLAEYMHFDYIVMAQGSEFDSKRLQKELRSIPSIELVAFIPLASLKSKDNFIF